MWFQFKLVTLAAGLFGKDCHVGQVRQVELLVQQPPLDEMIAYISQIYMDLQCAQQPLLLVGSRSTCM